MANIKSAEKRIRQNEKRRVHNRVVRNGTRTAVRKARVALDQGDENAAELVHNAMQVLDRAAAKGIVHKNNASRRKSRLMLALNKVNA